MRRQELSEQRLFVWLKKHIISTFARAWTDNVATIKRDTKWVDAVNRKADFNMLHCNMSKWWIRLIWVDNILRYHPLDMILQRTSDACCYKIKVERL
jgi:hypothetical protein